MNLHFTHPIEIRTTKYEPRLSSDVSRTHDGRNIPGHHLATTPGNGTPLSGRTSGRTQARLSSPPYRCRLPRPLNWGSIAGVVRLDQECAMWCGGFLRQAVHDRTKVREFAGRRSLMLKEHANDTTRLAVHPRPDRQAHGARDSPFLVWKRHQSRTRMERYFIERPEARSRRRTRQPEYGR